ncbi:MAG: hypothetical protein ACREPS_08480, partial [Rhodanobacteraceae bacterium]
CYAVLPRYARFCAGSANTAGSAPIAPRSNCPRFIQLILFPAVDHLHGRSMIVYALRQRAGPR